MIRRPPRSTLFPYTNALPISARRRRQVPDRHRDGVLPARPPAPRPGGPGDQQQDRPGAADRDRAAPRRGGAAADRAAAAPESNAVAGGAHEAVDRGAARHEELQQPDHLRADRRRHPAPQRGRAAQKPEALRWPRPSSPSRGSTGPAARTSRGWWPTAWGGSWWT